MEELAFEVGGGGRRLGRLKKGGESLQGGSEKTYKCVWASTCPEFGPSALRPPLPNPSHYVICQRRRGGFEHTLVNAIQAGNAAIHWHPHADCDSGALSTLMDEPFGI